MKFFMLTILVLYSLSVSPLIAQAGTLDSTFPEFGADGIRIMVMNGMDDYISSVLLQDDHKIVVSGRVGNSANYDFAIARLKNELASDILELRPTLSLSVSPNPARNILYVTVPQSVAKALRLQVTGMDGKIWINREEKADAEGKIKLNVKDLPEGFYALRVVAGLDWGVISFVVH